MVRLKWVYGNTLHLAIPLEQEIVRETGTTKEDYYPPAGSVIKVTLFDSFKVKELPYELDGNVLHVTDDGTLPVGTYGVEVRIIDGVTRLRSMWLCQLEILFDNAGKLEEYDDFVDESAILDAAVFYFAKGDKGDPGEPGEGVAAGGTTGQVLQKKSNEDYDTEWVNPPASGVSSVNGKTGEVTLDAEDVGALPADTPIPSALADLSDDSTHRTVTDSEKSTWNVKYDKPDSGIPATDLAAGVIPDISGKADKSEMSVVDGTGADADKTTITLKSGTSATVLKSHQDVSSFITKSVDDLVNYYLKSETYTKSEVQTLINAVKQFTYEVVQTLPTATADTMHKIYLVPSSDPQTQNVKDEYITIDNGAGSQTRYTWEQIGSTAIDLSGYVTTTALNTALADYTTTANLTTLLAGKQDVIDSSHKLSADLVEDGSTNKVFTATDKNKLDGISTMGASGSGHKGGLVPDTPSTAGTTKFLREDGTWNEPAGGSAAAYTPTLQSAPTSSTTTYTKDGQTVDFEIGQFARVVNASNPAGYDMWQMYDLTTSGNTKTAAWKKTDIPANNALIGPNMGSASSASFDAEADTVHVIEQTLSPSQKTQARTNIGAADASTVVNSSVIRNIVTISQSDYANLSSKDNMTLYIII